MKATMYVIGAVLLLPFLAACSADSDDSPTAAPSVAVKSAWPKCDDAAVMKAASDKLATWLNENVGKDNAYHVHGSFLAEISSSNTEGRLGDTQQCLARVSVGSKDARGRLHIAGVFPVEFILTSDSDEKPQIALDEAGVLSRGIANAASDLLIKMAIDQDPKPPSAAPINDRAPIPAYVVVSCKLDDSCDIDNPGPDDSGKTAVFTSLQKCVSFLPSLSEGGGPPGKMIEDRLYLTIFGAGYFKCIKQPSS
jgi:hypothetical protein